MNTYNYFYGELGNYDKACYFAPERFVEGEAQKDCSFLKTEMDIFSAGCIIAEILMDGTPIFDLEKLRQYTNK